MRIHDISVRLAPSTVVWEGDEPLRLERLSSIADGEDANVSRLACGVHVGTHVDAPLHFIDGAPGVDESPLEALIGPAVVVDASELDGHIDRAAVAALPIPEGTERVLFRTRNSALWADERFEPSFVALTEDGARALVERGLRLAGVDYLSIAPFGDAVPTHRTLLGAGIVVVEGLDLRAVAAGRYELICLPLRLVRSDGAPARAILIER